MKKILLVPDSFKGTMSSTEICAIMTKAILKHFPHANVVSIPVADGGEGTVDAFLQAVGGTKIRAKAANPFFEEIESFYGILSQAKDNKKTAIIEMAACAGLPLAINRLNPAITTSYGVGQLIENALEQGCKKIILGLGGSATNDGGCGAAAALGVQFFNKSGKIFVPTGGTLKDIEHIDISNLNPLLKSAEIISMCDIDNPLFGENGAAAVFAPQKGADSVMVQALDAGLVHLATVIKHELGLDKAETHGAGAAGGMGYGMLTMLASSLKMGIETILDTVSFDEELKNTDLVFSGEGKIDVQSLRGKVVIGVARRAKKANIPLIAVVGDIGCNIDAVYDSGVSGIFSINRVAVPYEEAKLRAKDDLYLTMDNIMRLIKSIIERQAL